MTFHCGSIEQTWDECNRVRSSDTMPTNSLLSWIGGMFSSNLLWYLRRPRHYTTGKHGRVGVLKFCRSKFQRYKYSTLRKNIKMQNWTNHAVRHTFDMVKIILHFSHDFTFEIDFLFFHRVCHMLVMCFGTWLSTNREKSWEIFSPYI